MKRTVLLLAMVLSCTLIFGQAQMAKYYYTEGKAYYDDGEYEAAIDYFKKAMEKDESYTDALYYLGLAHKYSGNDADAIEVFDKLESVNPDYWGWFYYERGKAHENLEQWDDAKASYGKFVNRYDPSPSNMYYFHQAYYRTKYSELSPEVRARPKKMKEPVNLGPTVNSISWDMMPQVNPTGDRLYFTSQRKGGLDDKQDEANNWGDDIWYSEKDASGNWGPPVLLPEPINTYNNDGTSTFTADGQTMIYVKCGENDGIGSCDLYQATLEGKEWTNPVNLGNVVNSDDWDSQPTLSSDGNTLIFTSTRDYGYGNEDLYISRRNEFGEWGIPVNMGEKINTPFQDKSPYLAPDGKSLYFASDGHPGFGDFDLFLSVYEDGEWSTPKNLGAPLNSSGEDTYFTISASGEEAFFASTRGKEDADLYKIEVPEELRPKPSVVVKGIVTDAKTGNITEAWVLVEDIHSGELIATAKSNSATGQYLVVLPSGRDYSVSANKEGYFFYSNKFDVPDDAMYQEITKDIELKPIEVGTKVVLNNIFFETGKATLTEESYIELSKAVELMKANSKMKIEVGGHTDNVGADDANMTLSHERAKSVRNFMVKSGITSERIQAKGYGETEPIADNETEEGRAANRRTEFVILEN